MILRVNESCSFIEKKIREGYKINRRFRGLDCWVFVGRKGKKPYHTNFYFVAATSSRKNSSGRLFFKFISDHFGGQDILWRGNSIENFFKNIKKLYPDPYGDGSMYYSIVKSDDVPPDIKYEYYFETEEELYKTGWVEDAREMIRDISENNIFKEMPEVVKEIKNVGILDLVSDETVRGKRVLTFTGEEGQFVKMEKALHRILVFAGFVVVRYPEYTLYTRDDEKEEVVLSRSEDREDLFLVTVSS